MAKFKCVASGNIIEFSAQVDIESMRGHEGYIRIDEDGKPSLVAVESKPLPFKAPIASVATRGRPRKAA
jgi:hypothetical protein